MANVNLTTQAPDARNKKLAIILLCVVAGMVGLAYAAVPIYQIFCQVTGYGGTTQRADESAAVGIIEREMGVRFTASVDAGLALEVKPAKMSVDKIGSKVTVVYTAINLSDQPLSTTAGFNVAPAVAGSYFNKIECFCFTEQTLAPGEVKEMPVVYYLDPELDLDKELDTVREVTLFYAFYAS
ncbi:cytochrome c oxidase assembly protein [Maritalea porphyrae]|uniref:cytochrome c oxidase assembly protein n=1 Tax=Maritalea porphyrae TaxID=880732 RepID=UPI0022AFB23D|nr:cytochrome c oxidase assembly protein [Maritalea porphyrae]MCZ4271403.1 cytochrome c oxidase assembly protein [Maritalea porphyrae]